VNDLRISIGVTGHRWLEEPPGVRERVGEVVRWIAGMPDGELRPIDVVSPLAEGTDRLVAEEAMALGAELTCPLPFPADEYERDFASAESVAVFRALLAAAREVIVAGGAGSTQGERNAAYVAAGREMLARVDVLIAVWDGRPSRGEGGTAQIVAEAQERSIPVVWIGASAPHDVAVLSTITGESWQSDLDRLLS
jgi:hypothetical protein